MTNDNLNDVTKAFNLLPSDSSSNEVYTGGGEISSIVEDHIQGYVRTPYFSIFTVNQSGKNEGTLFICDIHSKKYVKTYKVPIPGMNHPSGAQGIGNFMVLGLQSGDYKKNQICFLNIKGLVENSDDPIQLLPLHIPLEDQTAASVGITAIATTNSEYKFVLAVSGNGSTTVYLSNETAHGLADPNLKFTKTAQVLKDSYEGIQLLTQADGRVFMIAFDSESKDLSFKDYFILYELSDKFDSSLTAKLIKKLHVYTSGGILPGPLKPHCRYGTGLTIANNAITCYATGRQPTSITPVDDAPVVDIFQGGTA